MTRNIALFALAALFAFNVAAQDNNPPQQPAPKSPEVRKDQIDDGGTRKLSKRERKDRIQKLDEKYQRWLIDVEPILLPAERDAFLLLETDAQRDLYIEDFWNRRDPDPKTSGNEYRDQYLDILEEVRTKYRTTTSDPARVLLLRGRPFEVIKVDCEKYLQPIEIWRYGYIKGLSRDVLLLFFQPRNGVGLRLWVPRGRDFEALEELLSVDGQLSGGGVAGVFMSGGQAANVSKVFAHCKDGEKILAAIAWMQNNKMQVETVFEAPKVDEEESDDLLRSAVITDPQAPKLNDVAVEAAFPGKRGGRTAAEMTLWIPVAQLGVKELEGTRFYNIDVTGEILKEGKLFDTYRYHFDYPVDASVDKLPAIVERFLRPAEYTARLKVKDVNSGAETIVEQALSVPEIHQSATEAAREKEGSETVSGIQNEFRSGEPRLRIVPLGNQLLIGLQHIETIVSGPAVEAVEFYLDGRKVMVKRQPPYTLDLDFGSVPQVHRVKAVGVDKKGKILTGDELVVNTGADPFRVRIVQPRVATKLSGLVRVEADVEVPEGERLAKVEIYYNEARLATLYAPPFVQTVNIPESGGMGYLRAVAYLQDEYNTPSEDVVFLNAPDYLEQVEVHLIELPTTVLNSGKPVGDLKRADFRVLDEGKPAEISKFEYVKNLPLSIGLAMDSSASMRPRMTEAQKAGAEFLSGVLRKGDKAFVVAFNAEPSVLQKWSTKLADLHAGLATLRAEESTALYDAIVLSLYHFHGVKGQKALVVISDGKDTSSNFTFDQTLEYSRRSGVPIYIVGIGIRNSDVETRMKISKLTGETGGSAYYIEKSSDLRRIYDDIQNELRSQYVLGIYPPSGTKPGSKWREVEVQVKNAKAKTIRGYYP